MFCPLQQVGMANHEDTADHPDTGEEEGMGGEGRGKEVTHIRHVERE